MTFAEPKAAVHLQNGGATIYGSAARRLRRTNARTQLKVATLAGGTCCFARLGTSGNELADQPSATEVGGQDYGAHSHQQRGIQTTIASGDRNHDAGVHFRGAFNGTSKPLGIGSRLGCRLITGGKKLSFFLTQGLGWSPIQLEQIE